jgi:uncharacterized protein
MVTVTPARTESAMERLMQALGPGFAPGTGHKPPVEHWNPPHCGDIDMRIAADGTWFYMGTPIGRMPLVRLFASVLRRDGDDHVLVTPVEKLGIRVDDAAFQAVEMAVEGQGPRRSIAFRTNVDDLVTVGQEHKLRFDVAADGALKPYIHVRRGLWARVTRALAYDLLALGEVKQVDGAAMFGIWAGGMFHAALPAGEMEGMAGHDG